MVINFMVDLGWLLSAIPALASAPALLLVHGESHEREAAIGATVHQRRGPPGLRRGSAHFGCLLAAGSAGCPDEGTCCPSSGPRCHLRPSPSSRPAPATSLAPAPQA